MQSNSGSRQETYDPIEGSISKSPGKLPQMHIAPATIHHRWPVTDTLILSEQKWNNNFPQK